MWEVNFDTGHGLFSVEEVFLNFVEVSDNFQSSFGCAYGGVKARVFKRVGERGKVE